MLKSWLLLLLLWLLLLFGLEGGETQIEIGIDATLGLNWASCDIHPSRVKNPRIPELSNIIMSRW